MMRISGPSRFYRSVFILVVAVFFYGTLYPFEFSFSVGRLTDSLAKMEWIPFWDSGRGRLHGIPDMVSNVLFAMPLGFFGLLAQRHGKGRKLLPNWWLIGLACGVTAEFLQLFSGERMASLTDAINAGVGAGAGAFLAGRWERRVTVLFGETTADDERIRLLLLFTLLVVGTLGPLDMTMDVSDLRADFASFLADPWGLHAPLQEEWILMAEYLVFGALAGRRIRTPLIVALPIVLESGQLFIASRVPSLGDALLGVVALGGGLMAGRFPALFKARNALVVVVAAIAAAGLSPYRMVSWGARVPFQWIPLVEYYQRTTLSSLFDAAMGVLSFGLLAALMRASLRVGRLASVALCAALAASIEIAQMSIPGRYPGITDVINAALGGWLGASLRSSGITAGAENPIGAIFIPAEQAFAATLSREARPQPVRRESPDSPLIGPYPHVAGNVEPGEIGLHSTGAFPARQCPSQPEEVVRHGSTVVPVGCANLEDLCRCPERLERLQAFAALDIFPEGLIGCVFPRWLTC